MLWIREDVEDVPTFHNLTMLHDGYPVTDLLDNIHLMRNDYNRDPELLVELPEELQYLSCRLRIQG